MKLIINKTTKLVEYAFDNNSSYFSKGDTYIIVDTTKIINTNPDNYEEIIVSGQNVPEYFQQKVYYWTDDTFVASPLVDIAWESLRNKRNKMLIETDWTQLNDVNIPNKQEWNDYRQLLRDLPTNTINPFKIQWPLRPDSLSNPHY
jgi:hypothetical protein